MIPNSLLCGNLLKDVHNKGGLRDLLSHSGQERMACGLDCSLEGGIAMIPMSPFVLIEHEILR